MLARPRNVETLNSASVYENACRLVGEEILGSKLRWDDLWKNGLVLGLYRK